jgi:hypothetical protein
MRGTTAQVLGNINNFLVLPNLKLDKLAWFFNSYLPMVHWHQKCIGDLFEVPMRQKIFFGNNIFEYTLHYC